MSTMRRPGPRRRYYSLRDSLYWDETDCLAYYGMLSFHEVFEVVGSQLTETDVEVLSFLLDETDPGRHPLDPAGWTPDEPCEGGEENPKVNQQGVFPDPALVDAWRRLQPRGSGSACPTAARHRPKSGLDLLLELERRGYLSEGKLEPLLQLLRVLTRHDLLPFVSSKKRRTVSPERFRLNYGSKGRGGQVCTSGLTAACRQTEEAQEQSTQQWSRGINAARPGSAPRRKKRGRGHRWTSRPSTSRRAVGVCVAEPHPPPPVPQKVSCDVRMRVRAEYLEHESALRGGVSSDKQQPLERQFELFSRASSVLRSRDLGSIICDIKFTELDNLELFWGDYLSGALLEALKGVFITDSLRRAAGREGIRLLITVDQDDYEEGRKRLMNSLEKEAGNWKELGDRS